MDWDEALRQTGPFFGRRMHEILKARRNALDVDELAAPLEELLVLREEHYVNLFPVGPALNSLAVVLFSRPRTVRPDS